MKMFNTYSEYEKELSEAKNLMEVQFAYNKEISKRMRISYQEASKHEIVLMQKARTRWWELEPKEYGNTNGNEGVQSIF